MLRTNNAFSSFSVNDLQKAKEFYGQTLGLKVSESEMGLEIHPGATDVFIYPKPNHQPASFTVLNLQVDDINEAVDELKQRGVRFEQYDGEIKTNEKGIHHNGGPQSPGSKIRPEIFFPCLRNSRRQWQGFKSYIARYVDDKLTVAVF